MAIASIQIRMNYWWINMLNEVLKTFQLCYCLLGCSIYIIMWSSACHGCMRCTLDACIHIIFKCGVVFTVAFVWLFSGIEILYIQQCPIITAILMFQHSCSLHSVRNHLNVLLVFSNRSRAHTALSLMTWNIFLLFGKVLSGCNCLDFLWFR